MWFLFLALSIKLHDFIIFELNTVKSRHPCFKYLFGRQPMGFDLAHGHSTYDKGRGQT